MKVNETISAMLDASPKNRRQVSRELGHTGSWATMVSQVKKTPQFSTVVDIAYATGYRVEIVNDGTGEVLGVVEPPCLENSRDAPQDVEG